MNMIEMQIAKTFSCDVLVAGGGLAGTAAAIAAAREGADVILLESSGCLGGQGTVGMVGPIGSTQTRCTHQSFGGIMQEILDENRRRSEVYGGILPYGELSNSQMLRFVLLDMADEAGVRVFFHCQLMHAKREERLIIGAYALTKSGVCLFESKQFIDATGDADLVVLSGEEWVFGSEPGVMDELTEVGMDKLHYENTTYKPKTDSGAVQPVSMMFTVGGVTAEDSQIQPYTNVRYTYADMGITKEEFQKLPYAGKVGFEENGDLLPLPQGRFLFFRGIRPGEFIINMSRVINVNAADVESLNWGELKTQQQVLPIIDMLRRFIPGFEHCYLINASMSLGIRESRRLVGRRVLGGLEAIRCLPQEDSIARASYIIDIHDPHGKGKAIGGSIQGDAYDIPYGTLLAKNTDNLLCCGRCISVDHVAHSSTRIMGTCMLTGQAAGTAAAMAIQQNCEPCELDVQHLRAQLRKNGMIL